MSPPSTCGTVPNCFLHSNRNRLVRGIFRGHSLKATFKDFAYREHNSGVYFPLAHAKLLQPSSVRTEPLTWRCSCEGGMGAHPSPRHRTTIADRSKFESQTWPLRMGWPSSSSPGLDMLCMRKSVVAYRRGSLKSPTPGSCPRPKNCFHLLVVHSNDPTGFSTDPRRLCLSWCSMTSMVRSMYRTVSGS